MQDWLIWSAAAGVVVILELFTGTFYLLMIAIGLAFGALAAVLGFGGAAQTVIAALIGIAATVFLRRSKYGTRHAVDAGRDPNVNLDIGRQIAVETWQVQSDGRYHARVHYRGAQWDVDLVAGASGAPGTFTIMEMRGSRLLVAPQ